MCTEVPVFNIAINRRIPLASTIASDPRFYDEFEQDQFNFVESIVSRSPLRRRDEANARERARVKALIDTGVTERSRISGVDQDAAFKRLKQKIEFQEEEQKHFDLLEHYR
ncbi:unnamed protein product [Brachionus calyciflorus]|uniref:Uncharacterized protein n=1 Tax=Brachionus calyciflorus TaxID=104777 RepID=A0A814IA68_9BILA|nr:unnamed protein product [Brachionus calyciflorus]